MLGYAATTDVRNVPMVVADADRSQREPRPRRPLRRLAEFHHRRRRHRVRAKSIRTSSAAARGWRWRFRPATARRSRAARPQALQVIADGSDANSTNVALGYATNLSPRTRRSSRRGRCAGGGAATERAASRPGCASGSTRGSRAATSCCPGVLALLLLVITTNLSSMGIVREKELGTLEQLNVTPLRRWELIVGKLLPYALVGMIDVCLVLGIGGALVRGAAAGQRAAAVRADGCLSADARSASGCSSRRSRRRSSRR